MDGQDDYAAARGRRTAVITGAAGGLGQEFCVALARQSAHRKLIGGRPGGGKDLGGADRRD